MDQPIFFCVSIGHSQLDGESSGSKQNLDEELRIPRVVTPDARKSKDASKTPHSEPVLHRST